MKEKVKINTMCMMSYDETKDNEYYIAVCENCGKYGISDNAGKILIPFEYDNISRVWFNVFQLSKNGKVGLADFGEDEQGFFVKRIIPCKYDYLRVYGTQETVMLNKSDTYQEKTSVYFMNSRKLLRDVEHCSVLRDSTYLIEFTKYNMSHLYDCRTGSLIYKTDMVCVDGYITLFNYMIQYITKEGRVCLVRVNDEGVKEFVFDSNCVMAFDGVETGDCVTTVGFLIEKEEGFTVLNEDGYTLAEVKSDEIEIKNIVEYKKDGKRNQVEVSSTVLFNGF